MVRIFDFLFSFFGLLVLSPVLLILFVITYFDTGSPLFRQERIGRFEEPFTLIKFRTMQFDTASVASHLVDKSAITSIGSFLRKSHLDELPQLWNVLKGNMSLVGPRQLCLARKNYGTQEKNTMFIEYAQELLGFHRLVVLILPPPSFSLRLTQR